jgi:hypothetical protein
MKITNVYIDIECEQCESCIHKEVCKKNETYLHNPTLKNNKKISIVCECKQYISEGDEE